MPRKINRGGNCIVLKKPPRVDDVKLKRSEMKLTIAEPEPVLPTHSQYFAGQQLTGWKQRTIILL